MPSRNKRVSRFDTFAREVRGFQKTLLWLITGSFVVSGVSSFGKASTLSVSQVAMTTLVGTIAGCFAVIATYLSWPQRPDEEYGHLITFDPAKPATGIWLRFILSLTALILYAAAPPGLTLPLVLNAVAMYFFFSALVLGVLAVREVERQEVRWNSLDSAQRQVWLDHRRESQRRDGEMREIIGRSRRSSMEINARRKELNNTLRGVKWSLRLMKLRMICVPIHLWTVRLRLRIGRGDRLLTTSERRAENDLMRRDLGRGKGKFVHTNLDGLGGPAGYPGKDA